MKVKKIENIMSFPVELLSSTTKKIAVNPSKTLKDNSTDLLRGEEIARNGNGKMLISARVKVRDWMRVNTVDIIFENLIPFKYKCNCQEL